MGGPCRPHGGEPCPHLGMVGRQRAGSEHCGLRPCGLRQFCLHSQAREVRSLGDICDASRGVTGGLGGPSGRPGSLGGGSVQVASLRCVGGAEQGGPCSFPAAGARARWLPGRTQLRPGCPGRPLPGPACPAEAFRATMEMDVTFQPAGPAGSTRQKATLQRPSMGTRGRWPSAVGQQHQLLPRLAPGSASLALWDLPVPSPRPPQGHTPLLLDFAQGLAHIPRSVNSRESENKPPALVPSCPPRVPLYFCIFRGSGNFPCPPFCPVLPWPPPSDPRPVTPSPQPRSKGSQDQELSGESV